MKQLYSTFCVCSSYNLSTGKFPPAVYLMGHKVKKVVSHHQSVHAGINSAKVWQFSASLLAKVNSLYITFK